MHGTADNPDSKCALEKKDADRLAVRTVLLIQIEPDCSDHPAALDQGSISGLLADFPYTSWTRQCSRYRIPEVYTTNLAHRCAGSWSDLRYGRSNYNVSK